MNAVIVNNASLRSTSQGSLPLHKLETVCVFCGANSGAHPAYLFAAAELGRAIALEGIHLVYGGGANGLMGAVAKAAIEHGGSVTAVVPHFIARRVPPLPFPHEVIAVSDMHTRKKVMFERADAFIALPGGIGTIEELTEVVTLHKLEESRKPVVLANLDGFWTPLLELFSHLERSGFMHGDTLASCLVAHSPRAILPLLRAAVDDAAPGDGRVHGSWLPRALPGE